MRFRLIMAIVIGLALFSDARAARLWVMAVNTTAIANAKVVTMGVRVTAADVAAGGLNPVLFVQNITFEGTVAVQRINQTGFANRGDIQGVRTTFIDNAAINIGGPLPPIWEHRRGSCRQWERSDWESSARYGERMQVLFN